MAKGAYDEPPRHPLDPRRRRRLPPALVDGRRRRRRHAARRRRPQPDHAHPAADDGLFYYGGGHFQKYAIDLGLGGDDKTQLAAELKTYLGNDLGFTFSSPQLAAGVRTSASDYAAFLRKILNGTLALSHELDTNATCTLPSACPTAAYSPAPLAWHYGYAHWIEDEPGTGDGAFSSPGAFGFYPWIDASKQYYGILARYVIGAGAYVDSANCGRLLRKAFLTGVAQ